MKQLLICLSFFYSFQSCVGQGQNEMNKPFQILTAKPNEKFLFVQENGIIYARIMGGTTSPTYECVCQSTGECHLEFEGPTTVRCVGSRSCPPSQPGEYAGCGWRKASKISNHIEIEFKEREAILNSYTPKPLMDKVTFVSPWQIEVKGAHFDIVKNEKGETIIEFAGGPKVKCNCDCEVGSCKTYGAGYALFCNGDCRMLPDGTPCKGCGFTIVNDK